MVIHIACTRFILEAIEFFFVVSFFTTTALSTFYANASKATIRRTGRAISRERILNRDWMTATEFGFWHGNVVVSFFYREGFRKMYAINVFKNDLVLLWFRDLCACLFECVQKQFGLVEWEPIISIGTLSLKWLLWPSLKNTIFGIFMFAFFSNIFRAFFLLNIGKLR